MDAHPYLTPTENPARTPRVTCALCSSRICALERSSATPFRCASGHALGVADLIVHPPSEGLDDALDAVARSLEQTAAAMENAVYLYRLRTDSQRGQDAASD